MTSQTARAAAPPPPVLQRELLGPVAVLTLNRPEARNSLSEALISELHAALAGIHDDGDVRAVVIAANGPAFSAGHDMKELTARRTDADRGRGYFAQIMNACSAMMQAIVQLPKPVVAAVQGVATAGAEREAAIALARKVALKSAYTVKLGKAAFYRQAEMSLAEAYRYAAEVMTEDMMARDAEEGIDAFIEKREPKWQGRVLSRFPEG